MMTVQEQIEWLSYRGELRIHGLDIHDGKQTDVWYYVNYGFRWLNEYGPVDTGLHAHSQSVHEALREIIKNYNDGYADKAEYGWWDK